MIEHFSDTENYYVVFVYMEIGIFFFLMDYIYDNHHQRLTDWNHTLLNPAKLEQYAQAISDRGAALKNCFSFIDSTVRPFCRPDQNQREVYNGQNKVHGLKFQSVSLPDGMIANLYGPVGKLYRVHSI